MFLLILESLGSTELLFILVMALVFFGPRKLPQISRSIGKNMAHFRKASEDFKRTWEKEVNIEETSAAMAAGAALPIEQNSILAASDDEQASQSVQQPTIQAIAPDRVVARQSLWPEEAAQNTSPTSTEVESRIQSDAVNDASQSSPKSDWL